MNDLIDARPSTAETFGRSYTKDQVESIKRELQLIKAFLKDVEEKQSPLSNFFRQIKHQEQQV